MHILFLQLSFKCLWLPLRYLFIDNDGSRNFINLGKLHKLTQTDIELYRQCEVTSYSSYTTFFSSCVSSLGTSTSRTFSFASSTPLCFFFFLPLLFFLFLSFSTSSLHLFQSMDSFLHFSSIPSFLEALFFTPCKL